MTKYHRQAGLNDRNFFSYSSGGSKFKIKVPKGFVSHETFLLDLEMAHSCFVLSCPLLCVYRKTVNSGASSSSYEDSRPME